MRRKKIIPFVILIIVTGGSILYFDFFRSIDFNPSQIEGSGTIEVTEIEIAPKIAGRIIDITRNEGEKVSIGQPLVSLAYDELAPQKTAAAANLENAAKSFARAESLFKTGSLPRQTYDNALTAYTAARSQYQLVMANIANAALSSPIDGIVLRANAERGELAFPGTPILIVADIKKPWIKVYVSETKIGLVSIGDRAELTVDSFPDKKFNGKVVSISNKAEFTPKTIQTKEERTKLVFALKIALENNNEELKPGMPADVTLFTGKSK